jgi:transposase
MTTANNHDLSQVIPTYNNISIKIIRPKLIADKGYISNDLKLQLRDNDIQFIYPYKKTQKKSNTPTEKKILKQRYIVENVFSWLQNYRRIRIRYDKHSNTFLQFYYFAMADLICKKIK